MNFGWTITTVIAVVSLLAPTITAVVNNHYNRKVETLKLKIESLDSQIAYKRSLIHRLNIVRGKLEFLGPSNDGKIQEEVISVAADASAVFEDPNISNDFELLQNYVLQGAINYREYIRTCLRHLAESVFQDQSAKKELISEFNTKSKLWKSK